MVTLNRGKLLSCSQIYTLNIESSLFCEKHRLAGHHLPQNSCYRAVDKREFLVIIRDNFCKSCIKTYVVTPHLNRLNEMVQISGHNIWFDEI